MSSPSPTAPKPFSCNKLDPTANFCSNRPRVTISINAHNEPLDGDLLSLELPPGLTVKDLKGFVEADTQFPAASQTFYLNGRPLHQEDKTLEEVGVGDGEMLAMLIRRRANPVQGHPQSRAQTGTPEASRQNRHSDQRPSTTDPEAVRQNLIRDENALASLRQRQPNLHAAVHDPTRWRDEFSRMQRQEQDAERERQNQIALLNEDPFNIEAQKKIEELIRQDRVIENLQHAYEHNPEGKLIACHLSPKPS